MTWEIALVLGLLVASMVAFIKEWLPVDIVTLLVLAVLILTGVLSPTEAFAGFANEIIIILGSIFVLSGALLRTGVMEQVGHLIHTRAGNSPGRLLTVLMGLAAGMSAVINNTNATAVLMPATIEVAERRGLNASRLLMPLAYASIMGGTCTLIGTSTNVAASGMITRLGLEPFSLFEFTPVGLAAVAAGILYFTLIGHRFLPERGAATVRDRQPIGDYLATFHVPEESKLGGSLLSETRLSSEGLTILAIVRSGVKIFPRGDSRLEPGDLLIVHGPRDLLMRATEGADLGFETERWSGNPDPVAEDTEIIEAMVMPSSTFAGWTPRQLELRRDRSLSLLAVYRRGHVLATQIGNLKLAVGDILMLQGRRKRLREMEKRQDLWRLGEVPHLPFRRRRGIFAAAALLVGVAVGTSQLAPLSVALLLAALSVALAGCVELHKVYELVEWRLLVLIGGMTSVGLAMQKTGAAELLAEKIVEFALPFGIYAVLALIALLTMALTEPLSNAAAALVVLPVALSTAASLDLNPRTFAVLVTLSASLSFFTPFEPACLLVFGPGNYRFRDFVKAGTILTAITFVIILLMVPRLWPL